MKILLMQPKYTIPKHVPVAIHMPLGVCYIAAVLREHNQEVKILDCLAEDYSNKEIKDGKVTYGLSDDEIIKRIKEFNPDIIGCSALFTYNYSKNVKDLCKLIKKTNPDIITVVGGMHATVKPFEVLSNEDIDFIIQGEADYTFYELVDALENKKDYSHIDGLGYKKNKKIHINKKEKFIENLDELPFPARDLLNIDKYFEAGAVHGFLLRDKRNINIITSRGCPAHCIFCTIHLLWGRKFRARSPENVLAEFEHIKKEFGAKHIQIGDDNFTFDINRAKEILNGMIERKMNLKWTAPNGVALWRMDQETLRLMKKAGCYYVKFGVESGNQKTLTEIIKKPQKLENIIPLIKYAKKIGLITAGFFLVGFPGETKKGIQDTFNFIQKSKLDWAAYTIVMPHYGTELREICEKNNYLDKHDDSDTYYKKSIISTPEFTSEWLSKKLIIENRRLLKYLLFHQQSSILKYGLGVLRRDPLFVFNHFLKIFTLKKIWRKRK